MNTSEWDGIIRFAQGVGFPALVAGFVLVRLDRTMKELVTVVASLKEAVNILIKNGVE